MTAKTLYQLYGELSSTRAPFLDRAKQCALLTTPSSFEEWEGVTTVRENSNDFPYQSVGSRGVIKITATVMNALFPISRPFVVFNYDGEPVLPEEEDILERGLADIASMAKAEFESQNIRPALERCVKQLIIAGNVTVFLDNENSRIFPLHSFVVQRRNNDSILMLIVKDILYRDELDELLDEIDSDITLQPKASQEEEISIYTGCIWDTDKKKYEIYTELETGEVIGESSFYDKEECPFLCVKAGDDGDIGLDYSNSYVWGIIADLDNLDRKTKNLDDINDAKSRYLIFLDQTAPLGSRISPADVQEAKSGQVLEGNANTLTTYQCYQNIDTRTVYEQYQILSQSVREYLLDIDTSSLSRDRVTATEVNAYAERSNMLLTGLLARLSNNLQLPLIKFITNMLESKGKIKNLGKLNIKPQLIAGVESIGKLLEANDLINAVRNLPMPSLNYVRWDEYVKRVLILHGIDIRNLLYTQEEVASMQQQRMIGEGLQKAAPQLVQQQQG